jgi:hypothetical protein
LKVHFIRKTCGCKKYKKMFCFHVFMIQYRYQQKISKQMISIRNIFEIIFDFIVTVKRKNHHSPLPVTRKSQNSRDKVTHWLPWRIWSRLGIKLGG